MSKEELVEPPKTLRWGLRFCTTLYIVLFPFLFYATLFSIILSGSPHMTAFMVGLIMFILFWVPLSMPISIYLMWSRYYNAQYGKARFFAALPIYAIIAVIVAIIFLELISPTP